MHIFEREKLVSILNRLMLVLISILLIGISFNFFSEEDELVNTYEKPALKESAFYIPFDQELIAGPLALKEAKVTEAIAALSQELTIISQNTRPDRVKETLLIALKSNDQYKEVENGEIIYLDHKEGLQFTNEKSSLCIKPVLMQSEVVLIEVMMKENAKQEKGLFVLKRADDGYEDCGDSESRDWFTILTNANSFGKDLFLSRYAGEDYKGLATSAKVGIDGKIIFLKKGDYLTWDNQTWQRVELASAKPYAPIAKVKSANSRNVEIEVWDEKGFFPKSCILSKDKSIPPRTHIDRLFSSFRLRTESELSCRMDNKRVFLKKGDWWLQTDDGWRKLIAKKEILDFISHKITGELFVIENIKKKEEEHFMEGYLFDSMRQNEVAFTLPLDLKSARIAKQSANKETSSRKKKGGAS